MGRPHLLDPAHRSAGFINQHGHNPTPIPWAWSRLAAIAHQEALRIVRDHELAADAAQEAVLRAWRHPGRGAVLEPGAWIRVIARREALRLLSRRPEAAPTDAEGATASADRADDVIAAVDTARALRVLPPRDRELLFRHYWADQSVGQIADELDLPSGTVKVRMHRARERLRAAARAA